ncbi:MULTISPECIES: hypothetical protein [Bacillus]|uniref:hypothetical protein n=1 Tax=Bacillus TaxID=1386 RepID=UPI001F598A3A
MVVKLDKEENEKQKNIRFTYDFMDSEWIPPVVLFILVVLFVFCGFWALKVQGERLFQIVEDTDGDIERTKVIAKEIGVNEKEIVLEQGNSYDVYTATTSKGTYKVKIKYEKDKPVIKNMSEVNLYLKENKDES